MKPGGGKAARAVRFNEFGDPQLVGLRGGGGKGQCNLAKPQIEQAIASRGLTIIITLGCRV